MAQAIQREPAFLRRKQVETRTGLSRSTIQLIEAVAAREAGNARRVEARATSGKPLDVLVQHLVTVALGGGFVADDLFAEVRATHGYRALKREEFDWAMGFVAGGGALSAYPDYHRVAPDDSGVYRVPLQMIARRHRMSVCTIVGDSAMNVAWMSGGRIGTIEESFIARLKPGDAFTFGGRVLELIRVKDMTAYVKKAARNKGVVPQ